MKDFYICSDDKTALSEFIAGFKNVIGPVNGIPARDAYTDEVGTEHEATSAVGNPDHWYACIRTDEDEIVLPEGEDGTIHIGMCDSDISTPLLGVWANGHILE